MQQDQQQDQLFQLVNVLLLWIGIMLKMFPHQVLLEITLPPYPLCPFFFFFFLSFSLFLFFFSFLFFTLLFFKGGGFMLADCSAPALQQTYVKACYTTEHLWLYFYCWDNNINNPFKSCNDPLFNYGMV